MRRVTNKFCLHNSRLTDLSFFTVLVRRSEFLGVSIVTIPFGDDRQGDGRNLRFWSQVNLGLMTADIFHLSVVEHFTQSH